MTTANRALAALLASRQEKTEPQAVPSYLQDLTAMARAGHLSPVVGRDNEILQVLEVATQRRKANAVLIGPAGAGKTAVAEGLAQLCALHSSSLPQRLQGLRVLQLDVGSLISGSGVYGEIEKRMASVLKEVQTDNTLLFIDELHTLVGAGGRAGSTDVAQWLKPHLARGSLRVLAATTAEEYSQIIARDGALERRFSPIYVQPMSDEAALRACQAHAHWLELDLPAARLRPVLRQTVKLARSLMRHRSMPDAAIDLLERSNAVAELAGVPLSPRVVTRAAARLVHLPDDVGQRLQKLATQNPGTPLAAAALGLRVRLGLARQQNERIPAGPGPCLLEMQDDEAGETAAKALAQALGSEVMALDAQAGEREIFGAEPGYVGYGQRRPIHRLLDRPFAVVHLRGLQAGQSTQRLPTSLRTGCLQDAEGRVMSPHVAVLSGAAAASPRPIGFCVPKH